MIIDSNKTNVVRKYVLPLARVSLIALFAVMLIAALHPDVRSEVRGNLVKEFRTVISTVEGKLTSEDVTYTVAKVKTRDSLALEIYKNDAKGNQKLVEKIVMPDVKDGYFTFDKKTTNLAIDDIDGDGRMEILAPSFDKNLVGRLNVYNYDPEAKAFQRVIR